MPSRLAYKFVGIEKVSSVEYIQAIFDCYQSGHIAVPIDKAGRLPDGYSFTECLSVQGGGGWFCRRQAPLHFDAPAQITFSSGTTGAPKAIVLSHGSLADVTLRLIDVMEIDSTLSEYCAVPPTFSFGLGRARVAAAVGGKLYLPAHGFDPLEFARMLGAGEINSLAAVPSLLRVLVANPELVPPHLGKHLHWLEIGSQPMSATEKLAIRRMFPNARIIQHYGLSEASRTTFLNVGEASESELESVGRPVGATEVRIDGEGHICIRGPHVAMGLLGAGGITPIVDHEGWLRTNDLGRIDARGFVHFLGRADHLINVGGIKVPAEAFEDRLVARLGHHAAGIAVAPAADPVRGQIVGIGRLPGVPRQDVADAIAAICPEFGIRAGDVRSFEVAEIPRTDTDKIKRGALTELFSALPSARSEETASAIATRSQVGMTPAEVEIARIWSEALGVEQIDRDDTFFDLGGDSLSAINVMLRMERAGISPAITHQIFEGLSVSEIAASMHEGDENAAGQPAAPSRRPEVNDAIAMTRAVLVAVVIGGHWLPFVLARMGSLSGTLFAVTNPLFRFGTPGFAIVYGLGLTFYNMPLFKRHPDRLRSNVRTSLLVLSGGVGLLALFRFGNFYLDGSPISPSTLLFSVLLGYLLLVATSVQLLRFLAGRKTPVLAAIFLSLTSLIASSLARRAWGTLHTEGFLDLARLMIVAKYSYPQMLGYAAIGMAMGLWIDAQRQSSSLTRHALLIGLALIETSALLTISFGLENLWFQGGAAIHMIIAYAGLVLIVFGLFLGAIRRGGFDGMLRVPYRMTVLTGTLAFLAFVGHELALSLHRMLVALGIPMPVSLVFSVSLFLGGFFYSMRRLYRLQYGR